MEEPAPERVQKVVSMWDLHKADFAAYQAGDGPLRNLCTFVHRLFGLSARPRPDGLSRCYCEVLPTWYEQCIRPAFAAYERNNDEHLLDLQALSGLCVIKLNDRQMYVIVRCDFSTGEPQLLLAKQEDTGKLSGASDKILTRVKFTSLLSSNDEPRFKLFSMGAQSSPRILGGVPQEEKERIAKRTRKRRDAAKRKAEQTREDDYADDAAEVQGELAELADGAAAQPGSSSGPGAGGHGGAGGAGGAGKAQQSQIDFCIFNFTPESIAQSMTIAHRKRLIEALKSANRAEKNQTAEVASLTDGVDMWSVMFRESQLLRKQQAARAGESAKPITARDLRLFQQTVSLDGNFCIYDLFPAYLATYYEVQVGDEPERAPPVRTEGGPGLRHRRQAIRMTSEEKAPTTPMYIQMSFFKGEIDGRLYVIALKCSGTSRWFSLFATPEEAQSRTQQVRFAVVVHEDLLPRIPENIRDALMVEPLGRDNLNFSYCRLEGVQETVECTTEWMRAMCSCNMLDLWVGTDRRIRESLRCGGRPVHDIVEETFLAAIQTGVREFNEDVQQRRLEEEQMLQRLAKQKEKEARGEKVDRRVKVPQNFTHNGRNAEVELPVPERVRFVLVPLLLAMTCASNLHFEHGPACMCCGREINNPLADPFFHKYVKDPNKENARLLGHLISCRLIEWACCWPMCEYLKKHR